MKWRSYLVGAVPLAALGLTQAIAADLSGDLSEDSQIEMIQHTGEGPDRVISINVTVKLGKTSFLISKDGKTKEADIPAEECMALWEYLLERDIGNMVDAPVEDPIPDQSVFTFTFRNRSESNTFSAYGVDFLSDTRYREIARAIIAVADKYGP
jgi:hypothetical protein